MQVILKMNYEKLPLFTGEFITLGQLLKHFDIISSGGMAKWYLSEHLVLVNNEEENRRGKKLYIGDQIEFPNEDLIISIVEQN